jgi:glycosyltransferase involved in cell wall biosynthesis
MKVALLTTDLGLTGIPKYVELLALALPAVGEVQVEVVCLQPPLDRLEALKSQGVPVHILYPEGLGRSRLEFINRLKAFLAGIKPDCVHTNLWTYNLMTSGVLYTLGIPEITTWHYFIGKSLCFNVNYLKGYVKHLITIHLQQLTGTKFIAIGDHIRRPGILEKNITTVFTGISIQNKIHKVNNSPLVLFQAARMIPAKGQEHLLRAVALIGQRENVEVWLAGDGPKKPDLEKLADDLSLKNVRFLGWRNDIDELFKHVDIAVLPSISGEGLPIFVIESMMLGLPVVGYDIPPLKALVTEDCGILAERGDIVALSQALQRLLGDAELRASMGEAAHRRAVEHFSDIAFAQKTLAVYRQACRREASRT